MNSENPKFEENKSSCSLGSLDYSKFNSDWAKGILSRLRGEQVQLENGRTTGSNHGPMTKLKENVATYAKEMGCPVPAKDSVEEDYFIAALTIAIACPESGWNPKKTYDERRSGGIRGAGKSKEANESRGLMQMTYISDKDETNGCLAQNQSDLDNPLVNLTCALAKMQRMKPKSVSGFSRYWSVMRTKRSQLSKAVQKECKSGYANIRNFDSGTAVASEAGFDSRSIASAQ